MTPSLSMRRFSIPAPAAHTSLLPSLPPPLPDKPGRRQHSKMGKFRVSTRKAMRGERGTVQALQCVGIKSHLHPHPALPRSTTGFSTTRRGAKESRGKHPRENKEGRGWNHWERPAGAASLTALPQLPAPRNPIPAPGCQQGVTSGERGSVHRQHATHPFSLLQRSNTPISGKSEAQFRGFLQGRTEAPNPPRFWGGLFPRSRRKMKSSSQNSSKEKGSKEGRAPLQPESQNFPVLRRDG